MTSRRNILLLLLCAPLAVFSQGRQVTSLGTGRQVTSLDTGWRFFLGDDSAASTAAFDDAGWRLLDLPHDWSIEGAFSPKNRTGQGEGGLPAGVGWYRKHFRLHPGAGRVYVDFDGVYRCSEVWINGHDLGKRPNGYISFRYELTPWLSKDGRNVLAVRVDNSAQPDSRWYTGSGIYRNVWLETTPAAAVDHWGVFVTTPAVSKEAAKIAAAIDIRNTGDRIWATVRVELLDRDGRVVGASDGGKVLLVHGVVRSTIMLTLKKPHLWSPADPYLYRIQVTVRTGRGQADKYTVRTGIREFRFDPAKGFFLNGQSMKMLGVCLHHDEGALGAAVNIAAIRRQLRILKDMGCNAIRTSHNPPAPELLDVCDSMGLMVMDEAFDMWRKKKTKHDYSANFQEWHARDLADQVRRDRNHPSVIVWSIGNEIREQFDSSGIRLAREL
ncbi:MAG TPA: glycoside hydrolase family 2 TIM barrel-domain containing protein, partial [Puia sp.]|nr:glycoside hydrolase family 2 TIM barrel-domain containing protein [Puia sp.]